MFQQPMASVMSTLQIGIICGFRGGAEGAADPFLCCISKCFTILLQKIKCFLTISSETLTLLYFASRIRPQCCMLHVLKSEVFIRWGGGGGVGG